MIFSASRWIFMPFLIASVILSTTLSLVASGMDNERIIPGRPCWHYSAQKTIAGLAVNNSTIYIVTEGAVVEAVSADTGDRLWTSELGGDVTSNIIADSNQVYLTTRSENAKQQVRSLSAQTGITNWISDASQSKQPYIIATGSSLIMIGEESISSISALNGTLRWSSSVFAPVTSTPVVNGSRLVVPTKSGIKVLSTLNGKLIGELPTALDATAVAMDGDLIYWGDQRGDVYAYDLDDKENWWQFKVGGRIIGFVPMKEAVVAASADNFVYLISRNNGKLKWKSRLSNRAASVSDWGESYVLILDISGEQVSVLDVEKGRLVNRIDPPSGQEFTLLPTMSSNWAVIATSSGVSSYRLEGCLQNRMAAH
jgi:outer membrane protein assembly factor BamB